jgi:hypothetical protein
MPSVIRLPAFLALSALLASLPLGVARASDEHCRVPMADWQPREAVKAFAETKGLTVRRIKIDDGCYEVYASDAQGRLVELRLDPATLEELGTKSEDDNDD